MMRCESTLFLTTQFSSLFGKSAAMEVFAGDGANDDPERPSRDSSDLQQFVELCL